MKPRDHQLLANIGQILLTQDQIRRRVYELGEEIEQHHTASELTLLMVLHGSLLFAADLMRALTLPVYLESFRAASYHGQTRSSGSLYLEQPVLDHLDGKQVLLVDDILDTGRTLQAVEAHLRQNIGAASVKSCVLLDKKARRSVDYEADFVGFEIEDTFVVGYGLDYMGQYRNLPFIGALKPSAIADDDSP